MNDFQYCPKCASELQAVSSGGRLRDSCPHCGWTHYKNPTAGVAVILMQAGKILLGKRQDGGWCIPCGHVEWDEDVEAAAVREFKEETGLDVRLKSVFAVHSNFHNPEQHTVGIWYLGEQTGGHLKADEDLAEVEYFDLDQIPPLVFPTDRLVIKELTNPRK